MRIRTAKQRAQRIDLYYFRHARGLRRWRYLLSGAVPLAALVWVVSLAAAGTRASYSAGPVSSAHAFVENRCEACHKPAADRAEHTGKAWFRTHASDAACVTCHDGPVHAAKAGPAPACAACHQEHRGRVRMAETDDRFCVQCHGELQTTAGAPRVARNVAAFPRQHPEFAAIRAGAVDPGRLRFNHAVHLKAGMRGPAGPETLACGACHRPAAPRAPLMAPVTFERDCARCHPLFFDERIGRPAPHARPDIVSDFVQQALVGYILQNPGDISKADSDVRRVPLNFPRPPEPPARNAQQWVARRAAADQRILWGKTCADCHETETNAPLAPGALPVYAASNLTRQWMPRAQFDHTPHQMVTCGACHAAEGSTRTADVLLPGQAACASCHAPSRSGSGRAESRCFECHRYHDWTRSHPVTPSFSLTDFK